MRVRPALPKAIFQCLWSYDPRSVDLRADKELIIIQVLNFGSWQDLQWLLKQYSLGDIRAVVASPRRGRWTRQTLNYWTLKLNLRLPKPIYQRAVLH